MKKLFDKEPKKKSKKLKVLKAKSQYRYTYDELNNLQDDRLEWFVENGFPEERDMARGIRANRKMRRLVTYGY
jgi:hypothetical protein